MKSDHCRPTTMNTCIKPDLSVSLIPTNTPLAQRSNKKTSPGGNTILFSIDDLGYVCNKTGAAQHLCYPVFGKEWRVCPFYIIQENRSSGECKDFSWYPEPSDDIVLISEKHFYLQGRNNFTHCDGRRRVSVQGNYWSPVRLFLVVLLIVFIRFLITQVAFELLSWK